MKEEENIDFEEVKIDWGQTVIETEYGSLYRELKQKCDLDNYLPPNDYNREKADVAHEICLQLQNAANDIALQKQLRHKAIVELGIRFNSHALRDKLKQYSTPANYKYTEKFKTANELYSRVLENGDDVEALEKIRISIENELLCDTIENIEERERKLKEEEQQAIKQQAINQNKREFKIAMIILLLLLLLSLLSLLP